VLAFHPFEADESTLPKNKLFKSMDAYLTARAKESQTRGAGPLECVCISISGGIDSMVVARLLARLAPHHGGYRVVGIHVDYANRDESEAEAHTLSPPLSQSRRLV